MYFSFAKLSLASKRPGGSALGLSEGRGANRQWHPRAGVKGTRERSGGLAVAPLPTAHSGATARTHWTLARTYDVARLKTNAIGTRRP